jgi:hypothetical protein
MPHYTETWIGLAVAAVLLVFALAASVRAWRERRLLECIDGHPNVAVHAVEIAAERGSQRRRVRRLLRRGALRENRDGALVLVWCVIIKHK